MPWITSKEIDDALELWKESMGFQVEDDCRKLLEEHDEELAEYFDRKLKEEMQRW